MEKLIIKRFDKDLPMPEYKTSGAVALDLCSRETVTILPGEVVLIPLNIAVKLPAGHFLLLANRSSTYKMGITCVNGIGIGDQDYCGDNDEYRFAALNFTKEAVTIERGTRVCQMVIVPFAKVVVAEVDSLDAPDRGGFGTTGKR